MLWPDDWTAVTQVSKRYSEIKGFQGYGLACTFLVVNHALGKIKNDFHNEAEGVDVV